MQSFFADDKSLVETYNIEPWFIWNRDETSLDGRKTGEKVIMKVDDAKTIVLIEEKVDHITFLLLWGELGFCVFAFNVDI